MKKLLFVLIPMIVFFIVSCGDTGELTINELAVQEIKDSVSINNQIAKLDAAGEFYTFLIKVMDAGEPISGASVTLEGGAQNNLNSITVQTNENGNAFFSSVNIGSNILTVSAENYLTVIGLVEFTFEQGKNYELIDGVVIPIVKNESAIIPLYNNGAGDNYAVISGKTSIETDLTNDTPEFPEGVKIKANLSGNIIQASEGISFKEYTLNAEGGFGIGEVNAEGDYSIKIPTGVDGTSVKLLIPDLNYMQKLADFNEENEPIIVEKNTIYGYSHSPSPIPYVPGAKITFSEPLPEGSGLKINVIGRSGRKIVNENYYSSIYEGNESNFDGARLKLEGGKNYQSFPVLRASDPSGIGFSSNIYMDFAVGSLTLIDTGKYYANEYVSGDVYIWRGGQNEYITSFNTYTNSEGIITQGILNSVVSEKINSYYSYAWGNNYISTGNPFDSVTVQLSQSYISGGKTAKVSAKLNSKISRVDITSGGDNYIDPIFNFEGGNPDKIAELKVLSFATPWKIEIDNSNITSPYFLVPSITIEVFDGVQYEYASGLLYNKMTNETGVLSEFYSVNSDGALILKDPESEIITEAFSIEEPSIFVNSQDHKRATANVNISDQGEVESLSGIYVGIGYGERFEAIIEPSIEGLPGTGAEIDIRGGVKLGDAYIWDRTYYIKNKGSNYIRYVNKASDYLGSWGINAQILGSSEFRVYAGDQVFREIIYGNGKRTE